MEFDKARHLLQVRIAVEPDLFERVLGALADAKPVHRNEHLIVSWFTQTKWRFAACSSMPAKSDMIGAMQDLWDPNQRTS
jgi:hypothetical protein